MAGKLTKVQMRCLTSVVNGTVSRHFDVYAGYQWQEGEFKTGWRSTPADGPSPIVRLSDLGLIELGNRVRPYSGRHIETYSLTAQGRAAIAEHGEG